jgi:hypothetical protein
MYHAYVRFMCVCMESLNCLLVGGEEGGEEERRGGRVARGMKGRTG